MEIREYTEADRETIIKLWKLCNLTRPWNEPNKDIDRKISYQPDLFFVGTIKLTVVASAMAGYDGHRGSVFYLAIHPDFQDSGLGKNFMNHIEGVLFKLGCPKLNIVIRSTNERVLGFYNSLLYKPDDVINVGKRLISDV